MYAKYVYQAGATVANILNDVVLILTGTTDKTLLSTGPGMAAPNTVAQIDTYINVSSKTSGWIKHSTTFSGTNAIVLRAPLDVSNVTSVDLGTINQTQYKFCEVLCYDNYKIGLRLCEYATTVNPAVFTNKIALSSMQNGDQPLNTTTGGYVLISASETHIALYGFVAINSIPYGNASNGYNASYVFERTRISPYDTNSAGYPPVVQAGIFISGYSIALNSGAFSKPWFPRIKGIVSDSLGVNPFLSSQASSCSSFTISHRAVNSQQATYPENTTKTMDASGNLVHVLHPIYVRKDSHEIAFLGGELSTFSDIWFTTFGFGNNEDEVIVNGNTYVIWKEYVGSYPSGCSIAVRKG